MKWLYERRKIILLILVFVIILAFLPYLRNITAEDIANITPSSIPVAALIFLALYSVKAIIMILPVVVLYIAAGVVFPTGWAFAVTCAGLFLELSIGYLNGKFMGEKRVKELFDKKPQIAAFLEDRNDHMSSLCFVLRILPMPFDLLSMFFGAAKMSFGKYIFTSLLGLLPTMIPFVLAAGAITNPLSVSFLLPVGISLTVTVVLFIIYRIILRKGGGK